MLSAALVRAPDVSAQDVGKIQGRIIDTESRRPIASAQVIIAGTRLGNITNEDGYYFINNVPAGVQQIQAHSIGYRSVTVQQQRILAGHTLTQDFLLTASPIAIAPLEVIGEIHPLVPRDQVSSRNIVTGDAVEQLPVDDVRSIIRLQPGVVQTGRKDGMSIRGGRSGEEAVFVDGVLMRGFNAGDSGLKIGTNSLAEVDVITGGFSAEYGEAQSGIINYVTRSAGPRWNGALSLQTDELLPREWSLGFNRGELSIGGPLYGNLGFFAAGTATGQKSANMPIDWRDVPIYIAHGIDTVIAYNPGVGEQCVRSTDCVREVIVPNYVRYDEGGRTPYSNNDEYTLDAKLDYTYGSGSRVFLTGKASRNQARTNFGGGRPRLFNTQGFGGTHAKIQAYIMGWTHNIVRSAERALAIDVKVARYHDYFLNGLLDPQWDLGHRNPAFGFTPADMQFMFNERKFAVNETLVRRVLENHDSASPLGRERTDLTATASEFRMNPYATLNNFATQGIVGAVPLMNYWEEWQWQYRAAVDWQVNRSNRLKLGGEYIDIDVARYNGPTVLWLEKPKRQGLFVQNRLDLGDVVVEGGVRYDRFDPNSNFPVIPGYYIPDDSTTYRRATARVALSPRLGVSFPVTVNSTFRLSYGHFTQLPDMEEYYRGKNTDYFRFRNTHSGFIYSQGALQLARTIAFEFGYRQLLGPDFVLDIAAFNRDKQKDVSYRSAPWDDPTNPGNTVYLITATNADFGNVRGVDVRLDRRFGRVFNSMLAYSYQDARNSGTDPFSYFTVWGRLESNASILLGLPPNPPGSMRITEENRTHNLSGNFILQFPAAYPNKWVANFGLSGTLRVMSGLPYTPSTREEGAALLTAGQGAASAFGTARDGDLYTSRMPAMRFFDLKAQRGIRLNGWNAQMFVDARNVFDLHNQTGLFTTTGDINDAEAYRLRVGAHRQTLGGGNSQDRIDLRSLSAAGAGVRNEVDLYLLQQAETRFGDGDGIFTAAEQEAAFLAAEKFLFGPQDFFGPGRRVRIGLELTF